MDEIARWIYKRHQKTNFQLERYLGRQPWRRRRRRQKQQTTVKGRSSAWIDQKGVFPARGLYKSASDLYFKSKNHEMRNTETSLNKVKTRFILPYGSANTDKQSSESELSHKTTPSHQPTAYSGRQMDVLVCDIRMIRIKRRVHGGSNRGLPQKMKCLEGGQKPCGNAICCSQMEWQKFGK